MLDGERTIEVHGEEADLLALLVEVRCDLFCRLADGAHRDDDAVRIGCAVVVKEVMLAARDLCEVCHGILDELRDGIVVAVDRLALLEVDVRVLCRAADDRMIRIQCTAAEGCDRIPVEDLAKVVIVHNFDLLDLVGRAEAVKEVDERHAALDGNEVSDSREVHDLLYAGLGEHRAACLASRHDILLVAEDVQRARRKRSSRDMEDARQ